MNSNDQSISVIPSTLNKLIVEVSNGGYRIPQFQREYVWQKSKVITLLDSIYQEYPIGSFFLWKAGREHNRLFRHLIDLNIPPIKDDDDVSFILDGQQRIISLYVTLQGLTVDGTDYSRICFDVKDEKFTHREPDNKRYVRVCDIWGPEALEIVDAVDKTHKTAYRRCFKTLQTYPLSIVEVSGKNLQSVCKIFQRINQAGKRLDRFDLISSMTFTPDFDLREKFRQDINIRLKQKAFEEISPAIVTQLMALVKKGACTEQVEYSLTADEIMGMWQSVVDSVLLAADTLRKSVGVQNVNYLPYNAILILLAYYFAKSERRSLAADHMRWVKNWFWRASFSQHYGSGGATKISRDKEMFDKLLEGKTPFFEPPITLTIESLVATKMTWTGSAIRNAFLCLLANSDPVHLVNNSKLDLVNGGISDFTSPEKHHIFPQAFLKRSESGEIEVHALPNFCFLPAELNKLILDNQPSIYFHELIKENKNFEEAAKTHLIPTDTKSGIQEDNYLQFLRVRGKIILAEIERLCGVSTLPPEEQRQRVIEKLEQRIRDLIHNVLIEVHGEKYWKTVVPEDIRNKAEEKIATELKKQPELKPEHFASPRQKLNFCNFADYLKIAVSKQNWLHFEKVFRRQRDLERHIEAFADFRNTVMHHRELTELCLKAGELAMIWLENILPPENGQDIDTDQDQENI